MEPLSFVTKTHTNRPVSVAMMWYYDYHRIPSSKLLPSPSYFKWWCNTIVNHSPMWQGDSVALFILIELRRWYNHYYRLSSSQLRSLSLKNDNDLVTMMIQSLLSAVIVATKVIIIKKWFVMVLHIPIVYDDVIQSSIVQCDIRLLVLHHYHPCDRAKLIFVFCKSRRSCWSLLYVRT